MDTPHIQAPEAPADVMAEAAKVSSPSASVQVGGLLRPNMALMSKLSNRAWAIGDGGRGSFVRMALFAGDDDIDPEGLVGSAERVSARSNVLASSSGIWSMDAEYFNERIDAHVRPSGIGIIPVRGVLFDRGWWCFMGYDQIEACGWALVNDPRCSIIVIPVGSPGGMCMGLHSLCSAIRAWREVKPVITVSDPEVGSAAEAIAAQGTFSYTSIDSTRGHIGTWVSHDDMSELMKAIGLDRKYYARGRYKTFWQSDNPRGEDADYVFNRSADYAQGLLLDSISKGRTYEGRRMSPEQAGATEAALFHGAQAIDAGIADYFEPSEDGLVTYPDLIWYLENEEAA